MYEIVADLGHKTEELESKMSRIETRLDSMHELIETMPLRLIDAIMERTYSPSNDQDDANYMNAVLITPTCERENLLGEGSARRFSSAMTSISQ